jgi:hypothetical protein
MIEVWDSIESHQASVKNIPPEMLTEIRPLLESAPSGHLLSTGLITISTDQHILYVFHFLKKLKNK